MLKCHQVSRISDSTAPSTVYEDELLYLNYNVSKLDSTEICALLRYYAASITIRRCVIPQKSADLYNIGAEA